MLSREESQGPLGCFLDGKHVPYRWISMCILFGIVVVLLFNKLELLLLLLLLFLRLLVKLLLLDFIEGIELLLLVFSCVFENVFWCLNLSIVGIL